MTIKRITHIVWLTLIGIFIFGLWAMPIIGAYVLFTDSSYEDKLVLLAKAFLIFLIISHIVNTYQIIRRNEELNGTPRILIMMGITILIWFFLGLV